MTLRTTIFSLALLLPGSAALLSAQETTMQRSSPTAHLRALNETVLQHHELALHAGPNQAGAIRNQATIDIQQRETAMAALIETDPDAVLQMAFSPALLASLKAAFPASASHFEEHQTWTGSLQSAVEDSLDLTASRVVHRFQSAGSTLLLHFSGPEPAPTAADLVIEGVRVAGHVAVRSAHPAAIRAASLAPTGSATLGPQKIVTILVNLPNFKLPSNVTPDFMKGVLFGNANSAIKNTPDWNVDDFWQQNSDGQASAPFTAGQVVGPYLLASNFNTDSTGAAFCNYSAMQQAAINAADPAVNFLSFNRIVIVMPANGACTWSGTSGLGYWSATSQDGPFSASFHWLRADTIPSRLTGVELAAHELGHGFGMSHARSRAYPGPPALALGAIGVAGVLTEYGDPFSIMASWGLGFYNAPHAQEVLGWLTPSNFTTVQAAGQFTLSAYETRNALTLVKALRVLRDAASNSWLWIEFRTNTGIYDSQLPSQGWSGALIHYEDASTGSYTNLLDFTPATTGVFTDAALASGQTWTDPYSNLSIAIGGITATSAGNTLSVSVNYGTPACATASPSVSLSPSNPTVSPNGATNFTATVTSNNAAACPVSAYSLTTVQPSGFRGALSATSLTLAGGATGAATLTETASTASGTFPVSVTAIDTGRPADTGTGTGTANVTVAAICTAANPTVTLSPSAVSLAAGASTSLTVTLKNNNSAACAAASWNLTSVQPLGFSGTFSKTSLTGIASGASGSVTLTEQAGTSLGTFPLSISGSGATASGIVGTGTATLTVSGCTLANPVVSISQSNGNIKAGSSTSWTVNVKNTNSSGCPPRRSR
jgi:M6 family metalloprotease-like protein